VSEKLIESEVDLWIIIPNNNFFEEVGTEIIFY
jgi:hypothetical protein